MTNYVVYRGVRYKLSPVLRTSPIGSFLRHKYDDNHYVTMLNNDPANYRGGNWQGHEMVIETSNGLDYARNYWWLEKCGPAVWPPVGRTKPKRYADAVVSHVMEKQ